MLNKRSARVQAILFAFTLLTILHVEDGLAQQNTGTPGSPSATKTIDGRYIPAATQPFGGVINMTAPESKPF